MVCPGPWQWRWFTFRAKNLARPRQSNSPGDTRMKYELTKETVPWMGRTLYRIRATASFGIVIKGELGGFIESDKNLSTAGDAWVYGNARVWGDAQVYGNARVWGNAQVYGNTQVWGDAQVCGNTQVWGNAQVWVDAQVYGNAWVWGDAWV